MTYIGIFLDKLTEMSRLMRCHPVC